MITFPIYRISDKPELLSAASEWFSSKWHIPAEAYEESMRNSLTGVPVPRWYVCMDGEKIIAGMGVIANDFHDRKDLSPNVCAVYTEPEYRSRGICRELLGFVCRDMAECGILTLYLLTDHTSLYERFGWEYLCPALGDGEAASSRLYIHKYNQ